MLKISRAFALIVLLISCCACQHAVNREATRAQALLDEADLLINARMFAEAEQNSRDALDKMVIALERQPDNVDFRLINIRALMTLFFSRNVLNLEEAEIRPRSLTRFPNPEDLSDYDSTVRVAEEQLKDLINGALPMDDDQKAFAHATLATVYRLNSNTVDEALVQYDKAIKVYEKQLNEMRNDPSKVGQHTYGIMRLENQIRGLQQGQAEVLLYKEDWPAALDVLGSVMAGNDLKFFIPQFELVLGQIADMETRLSIDAALAEGSREDRLLISIREGRKDRTFSKRERLGAKNPYQVQLMQSRIRLADMQNNLMYRIICYFQLNDQDRLNEAREALRSQFPELDADLYNQLQEHR